MVAGGGVEHAEGPDGEFAVDDAGGGDVAQRLTIDRQLRGQQDGAVLRAVSASK